MFYNFANKPALWGWLICFFTGRAQWQTAFCLRWFPAGTFARQIAHKLTRTVCRVSDSKSAQHKKSSSAATWIFCMEPICFGIIKGEQPLVCNGDDRGQWPKQGGAVGAAACRMRVPSKARSRRREPQPAASRASKVAGAFLVLFWHAKENVPGGEKFCKSHPACPTRKRPAREANHQKPFCWL